MLVDPRSQNFKNLNLVQQQAVAQYLSDPSILYEHLPECPLCHSTSSTEVSKFDQYGIPLATFFCNGCGLIYSKDQLREDATNIFYDRYYRKIYEGVEKASLAHSYYQKLYSGWVPKVPSFISKGHTVLEIGCGGGWNLLPYKKKGIEHCGFDYDSDMISFGRENYGLNLHVGGLDEALGFSKPFDYIILSQVIEHLKDPKDFLVQLKGIMHLDTLLCLTVPSASYMNHFGGNSTHFSMDLNLQNAHNFFFSESTLSLLLRMASYEPILILGGYALVKSTKNPSGFNLDMLNNLSVNPSKAYKELVASQKNVQLKQLLFKVLPSPLWSLLTRTFYFARPVRTLAYFYHNYFSKRLPGS